MAENRRQILWIDDEIDTLRSHVLFLESQGYDVAPAANGQDGLSLLADGAFDAVLLDHRMAGMDGLDVLDAIKTERPHLPVVMVTQSQEDTLMDDALRHQVDDFLVKPVQAVQVARTLRRIVERQSLTEEATPQMYLRDYGELLASRSGDISWKEWAAIYQRLVSWDMREDDLERSGLAASHRELHAEYNRAFSDYVATNYPSWVRGGDSPPLSVDVLDRFVLPHVQRGEQVFFVVIDCMRLDQWRTIEPLLAPLFDIETELYYGILPSATGYARNALFSGLFPKEIAERHPQFWAESCDTDSSTNRHEKQLLELKLERDGLYLKPPPRYFKIFDARGGEEYRQRVASFDRVSLATLVVNFLDVLTHERSQSDVLQQIAPDERAFRSLMESWFRNSDLFRIFEIMAEKNAVVVVTTDHGSVLCDRASKAFGNRDTTTSLRFKVGERIDGDPEEAVRIDDPGMYQLPADSSGKNYLLAKEDYYFVYPTEFNAYRRQLKGGFQHGGISMQELLIPCATLRPR
ncbi:response regulator [Candidatus Poribacteria bacterium]|nr:response regulator [Candidatus Poribacteria bacterium]MBT7100752.1 response regulator [Candidatus Poribacteria bacterium]MBT7807985.1 response regulator [Candidatus Poribacteria bacterium]